MRASILSLALAGLLALVIAPLLAGCGNQTPAGPTVNNSGDGANFCIANRDAGCTTPAPVVVPPVVVPPVVVDGATE